MYFCQLQNTSTSIVRITERRKLTLSLQELSNHDSNKDTETDILQPFAAWYILM